MPVADTVPMERNNISFVRAVLNHYQTDKECSAGAIQEIFELVRNGVFNWGNPAVYGLADVARAHADLESRKTTGSIILRP